MDNTAREQHLQLVFDAALAILPLPDSAQQVAHAAGLLQGSYIYLMSTAEYKRWAMLAHDILVLMTNVYIQLYTNEGETRRAET